MRGRGGALTAVTAGDPPSPPGAAATLGLCAGGPWSDTRPAGRSLTPRASWHVSSTSACVHSTLFEVGMVCDSESGCRMRSRTTCGRRLRTTRRTSGCASSPAAPQVGSPLRQAFAKCPFSCQFDRLSDQLCQSLDRLSDHFAKH